MNVKNWFLRQLVEKGLIRENYKYYTDAEKQSHDYQQEELRKLEAGEEIRPPWGNTAGGGFYTRSWEGCWRQGNSEWWIHTVWYPFWESLNDEKKREYLAKFNVPPEDWYQLLVKKRTLENFIEAEYLSEQDKLKDAVLNHFNLSIRKEDKWLFNQKQRVAAGKELEPPWITFPISLPDVGWDDYFLEGWKLEVWIPFWETLNGKERTAYLKKWPPPNDQWKENITQNWAGKIRKTEDWFERQKDFAKNQGIFSEPILPPWCAFQKIPAQQTFWDEEFIDRWMREIWVPYWNQLNDEEQNRMFEYIGSPYEEMLQRMRRHTVKNLHKFKQ